MDPVALLAGAWCVLAQTAPPPATELSFKEGLGPIVAPQGVEGPLASTSIRVPGARWLRLQFGATSLPGDPAGRGAVIRLTSAADGAVQELTSESLAWWNSTSAYFNGDTITVELLSRGEPGVVALEVTGAWAGGPASTYDSRSLCGVDNRSPSAQPFAARYMPTGCTTWLFEDANHTFLTAGHCFVGSTGVAQFHVPLSQPDGTIVHPLPRDQYPVEPGSVQNRYLGIGEDWSYFGCYPSTQTGLTAYQTQLAALPLSAAAPTPGRTASISGYGIVAAPVSPTWNSVLKTDTGPFVASSASTIAYAVDTTSGNSGSAVVRADTGAAVAIHTNAGCTDSSGGNLGTPIACPSLQAALANPRGICRSGVAPRSGTIFVIGDANNNFGTIDEATGTFGQFSQIAASMQGLAHDPVEDRLYAVSFDRDLYQVYPATGGARLLGRIMGNPAPITGLGFDPASRTLFGISQADGQLWRINTASLWATRIGEPLGGNIGALDFDPDSQSLFGIDDTPSGSVLTRLNPGTGSRSSVGPLGTGITDCNGLAAGADGFLYTINAGSELLLRINPATGAATPVGPTGGLFGSGFGMAAARPRSFCQRLDYNLDGSRDQDDILALLQAIASGDWTDDPDFNADGNADVDDITWLVQAIASGDC
ncbi:MAG: hypothetical protein DYG92_04905 [Leptolyngbya sp. PLA1]|nr:hypothetical protein [Leptolyngbya sp. PLA1]